MSFLKLRTRSSAFMLPPSVAVYGANDMAPWGHMYVNPGLTEPQVKDELQAFQLGADEYLTKPCRKDRLLARVSNILKRYEGRTNLIEGLDFLLDQQTYTLYIHNTSVVLPKNQGKLLVALLASGDALVTTEQLCMALWGTTEYIDENALQVNLTRLKKTMSALEMKQRIVAVRGMGYRLEAEVSL